MSEMSVLSPNVPLSDEYRHRIRNLGADRIAELEALARRPLADSAGLGAHEHGVVECYRKLIAV